MVTQGAVSTGDEDDNKGDDLDVAHRALNINLDEYVTLNVYARTRMLWCDNNIYYITTCPL